MARTTEIRDPIHGFVMLNDWERQIVDHPVFQRLRRIRQLAWTDMVYPGANHTRFEHSLGVAHVATRMFNQIVQRRKDFLKSELSYTESGLDKDRVIVRLASLLHDVGHAPFSHASEEVMPINPETGKSYKHENYSGAAIVHLMRDVIEDHPLNQNYGIKAQEVADLLNGRPTLGRALLWRSLLSSQLDADRADYLLRDSHHIGVEYGRYDLNRLLHTMTVTMDPETGNPVVAVEDGGIHAAEGLIIARYMMFTQVYFQHTRRAYDHHITEVMKVLLAEEQKDDEVTVKSAFPPPTTKENVASYLRWNDWRVMGLINDGGGGSDGRLLLERKHHRWVYETTELADEREIELADVVRERLGDMVAFVDTAGQSWYKFEKEEIRILRGVDVGQEQLTDLSAVSSTVRGIRPVNQTRIYVPLSEKRRAGQIVDQVLRVRGLK